MSYNGVFKENNFSLFRSLMFRCIVKWFFLDLNQSWTLLKLTPHQLCFVQSQKRREDKPWCKNCSLLLPETICLRISKKFWSLSWSSSYPSLVLCSEVFWILWRCLNPSHLEDNKGKTEGEGSEGRAGRKVKISFFVDVSCLSDGFDFLQPEPTRACPALRRRLTTSPSRPSLCSGYELAWGVGGVFVSDHGDTFMTKYWPNWPAGVSFHDLLCETYLYCWQRFTITSHMALSMQEWPSVMEMEPSSWQYQHSFSSFLFSSFSWPLIMFILSTWKFSPLPAFCRGCFSRQCAALEQSPDQRGSDWRSGNQ